MWVCLWYQNAIDNLTFSNCSESAVLLLQMLSNKIFPTVSIVISFPAWMDDGWNTCGHSPCQGASRELIKSLAGSCLVLSLASVFVPDVGNVWQLSKCLLRDPGEGSLRPQASLWPGEATAEGQTGLRRGLAVYLCNQFRRKLSARLLLPVTWDAGILCRPLLVREGTNNALANHEAIPVDSRDNWASV